MLNESQLRRRNFLRNLAVAAAPIAIGTAAVKSAHVSPQPEAGSGTLRKAISIWAFPPKKPIRDCMNLAKEAGFHGIELALAEEGEVTPDTPRDTMRRLAEDAKRIGLEVTSLATGTLWKYPLTSSDASAREKGKAMVRKMLELAAALGVDAILVVPGNVGTGFSSPEMAVGYETAYQRASEAIQELAPVAEKYKVSIAIENVWNKFLLSPLEMRRFVDEMGSKYVGAYLDVGNVLLTGFPQDWVRTLGSRIRRVHVKDFKLSVGNINGFVGLLEGDLPWKETIAALREVNYRGPLIAEVGYNRLAPDAVVWNTSRALDFILALA